MNGIYGAIHMSCEINGVVLCSTPQINGELVSDGLLYSMEDGDGGIIEVLFSHRPELEKE